MPVQNVESFEYKTIQYNDNVCRHLIVFKKCHWQMRFSLIFATQCVILYSLLWSNNRKIYANIFFHNHFGFIFRRNNYFAWGLHRIIENSVRLYYICREAAIFSQVQRICEFRELWNSILMLNSLQLSVLYSCRIGDVKITTISETNRLAMTYIVGNVIFESV